MSTLNDAKLGSLKDKILTQEVLASTEAEVVKKGKEDDEEKKGKGRIKKSKSKK